MTSYILREPAYHSSAKLAAKLARIDNLGYASDIRLQSAYGQQYNQAPASSTVTSETQTELNPVGTITNVSRPSAVTQTAPAPTIPQETISTRAAPRMADIVGATPDTPQIVRETSPSGRPTFDINQLKERLSTRSEEQERPRTIWPEDIMTLIRDIAIRINKPNIQLNRGQRSGIKPLYTIGGNPELIEGVSLYIDATDMAKPILRYKIGQTREQGVLTPDVKKFGFEKGNIDIKRALNDFMQTKANKRLFGTGLHTQRKPIRKSISIHWEDRIMPGDANYVLRNPFLSGRISYYPYGAHMNQILIRNPSKYAMNIVRDLVEEHTFKQSDYDELQKDDGDKINQIIKLSQVVIPHDIRMKGYHLDDIAELKQRYKVLVGEIGAGNHGKLLFGEMRDIVKQLAKYRAISDPTKRKMLKQIDAAS